jgi:hypothetical protein
MGRNLLTGRARRLRAARVAASGGSTARPGRPPTGPAGPARVVSSPTGRHLTDRARPTLVTDRDSSPSK